MGRLTSCFKLVSCGSESADNDDLHVSESKGSNDKRGWSFRKRSASHRVLSNSVITETPASLEKENPVLADVNFQTSSSVKKSLETTGNFQPPNISSVLEKVPTVQLVDEKIQLSTPAEQRTSKSVIEKDAESKGDSLLDELVAIVIQAAIRGSLAQRELSKLKYVVKLQAAVRGHLVRMHAIGTLRCVRAIIKMQALVHARRAYRENEPVWKEKNTCNSRTLKGNSVTKPYATNTSLQNLLSNRFACQLMESTPKNKPIHVKCDPAKQDSAWTWLERWTSVLSATQTSVSKEEHSENGQNENITSPVEKVPSEGLCESADSKSSVKEADLLSEIDENLITHDADKFNFPQSQTILLQDDLELPQPENNSTSDVNKISIEIESYPSQITQSDASSQQELKYVPNKSEMESEPPKCSMKRVAFEDLETEEKKFAFGSRKANNMEFIVAQSKFEELSSSANSGRSVSPHHDVSADSNAELISSGPYTSTWSKDLGIKENSVSRIQYDGSECATELSIASTLDSLDRSEVGTTKYVREARVSEKEIPDCNNSNNLDDKANDASTDPAFNMSHSIMEQAKIVDDVHSDSVNSIVVIDTQVKQKIESSASDFHKVLASETERQAYRSSPEASPRSHITVSDSQATPSSQVPIKSKNKRSDKNGSNRKRKPLSASKGSPSNPNNDSGARSSTEPLQRGQKNGNRHSSFGSLRTNNNDQESGHLCSSSSLPRFMQATESARAKVQVNNSPRSSPDLQERDFYIKKRHSLPVANGRQGSPHVQRSLSQAPQTAEGNEKKWQR